MDAVTRDLLLAQDGDDQAFSRVVQAVECDVRRFCSWLTRPGSDLDDLVQETFLRAFRGLTTYMAQSPARPWILSIARRVCLDAARKNSGASVVSASVESHFPVTSGSGSLVEIEMLIADIPTPFRDAFILVKVFGYSYDEVGVILGCPRGTVQSRVARAREFLARALQVEASQQVG
jgi:RNA polymerase sigma-70 factor (ECF subfamily)